MIDRQWIGHDLGRTVQTLERGRLAFFARAIGETQPVYFDVAQARAAGHPDVLVPPTFLFSAELDSGVTFRLLDLLGVPIARILHGEQGFTFHQPVHAGDTVTVHSRIADIYDKKNGAMEFIVKTSQVHNQHQALVAEMRSVIVVRN